MCMLEHLHLANGFQVRHGLALVGIRLGVSFSIKLTERVGGWH